MPFKRMSASPNGVFRPALTLIQRDLVGVRAVEGIGIKAKEYKETLFMILFDGAKCSSHASTIRVVVDT